MNVSEIRKSVSDQLYSDFRKLYPAKPAEPIKLSDESIDLSKIKLQVPTVEAIYTRREFVTDESMGESCAYCYTYMERMLVFESENGVSVNYLRASSENGYFAINMDKSAQSFGKSGADMNNLNVAVEETWEYRSRSVEQSTMTHDMLMSVLESGRSLGSYFGYAEQTTAYKYTSVSETKGTAAYKNGAVANYTETAVSTREIYNKCAVFLAEAFGEKISDLVLDDKDFNDLFGKPDADEKTYFDKAAQRRENLNKQLSMLREFMERNLNAVRRKNPKCGSLKTFEATYMRLQAYKTSDISSFVEKMLAVKTEVKSIEVRG